MNFKKIKKIVTALALTVMLGVISNSTSVGALPPPPGASITAPELKVKKEFTVPEGITTPTTTFEFEFAPYSFNSGVEETYTGLENGRADMPALNTANSQVEYTEANTATADPIIKESKNVLEGVTFPKVGQYTYKLTEKNSAVDGIVYSTKSYLVSIFTETNQDGNPVANRLEIVGLTSEGVKDGEKVMYTPDNNNLVFKNSYEKETEFTLTKEVAADAEPNQLKKNKYTFAFTVQAPQGIDVTNKTFEYGIGTDKKTGNYGEQIVEKLQQDQQVVFSKLLAGSKITADETDSLGYIPSVKSATINGQDASSTVTLEALNAGNVVIGDQGENSVVILNTQQTPTGILLDNLPFIVLAVLAGTGIIFFVKNRNNEEEMEA